MKRIWIVALFAVTSAPVVTAGRPLVVDDAGTVERGHFQLEAGVGLTADDSTHHFDLPLGLSHGLLENLQVGLGFGAQWEQRREVDRHCDEGGVGDLVIGAKWHPLSSESFWADHSLALAVKLPTADCDRELGSGKTDVDLTYIATKSLGEKFNLDFNLGYTWVGGENPDVLHYGLALRWQAFEQVELVGEVFADTALGSGQETPAALNAGLRWELLPDVVLDAAVGVGLNNPAPDWTATLGVTWTFGLGN